MYTGGTGVFILYISPFSQTAAHRDSFLIPQCSEDEEMRAIIIIRRVKYKKVFQNRDTHTCVLNICSKINRKTDEQQGDKSNGKTHLFYRIILRVKRKNASRRCQIKKCQKLKKLLLIYS